MSDVYTGEKDGDPQDDGLPASAPDENEDRRRSSNGTGPPLRTPRRSAGNPEESNEFVNEIQ